MTGLRLLLVTDAVGGVWTYSLDLANALAPLGVETIFAITGPAPSNAQREAAGRYRLIETGLPLDWLAEDAAAVERTGEALAALAKEEGADLVQVPSGALIAGGDFDRPIIAVQHSCVASWWQAVRGTTLPEDFRWRTDLVRRGLRKADAVVAPSRAFADTTAALYRLSCVHVVHNGRAFSSKAAWPADFVFTAGRLWDEGKDLATLDRAAEQLTVPVLSAGPLSGPHGARFKPRALDPLGVLKERELADELARRPLFVSTARYEPFGLAVLEAASAGCALVLSDIPTFRELWDGTALFVPPGDAEGFTRQLNDLISHSLFRVSLGRAARRRAARYTPAAMAEGMLAIYASLLPRVAVPRTLVNAT